MATPSARAARLLLVSAVAFLSAGAEARPGVHFHPYKALLISYTVSSTDDSTVEVSQISAAGAGTPSGFFAVYRISPLRYYHRSSYFSSSSAAATEPLATSLRLPIGVERPSLPRLVTPVEPFLGISSSLREHAKDVLMVVAGLLFGVGCGALTSATMYLAWSLINNRYEFCRSEEFYYDDDEEEDVESPKKMGYVDLPPAPATPITPIKEGYEGK